MCYLGSDKGVTKEGVKARVLPCEYGVSDLVDYKLYADQSTKNVALTVAVALLERFKPIFVVPSYREAACYYESKMCIYGRILKLSVIVPECMLRFE